MSTADLQKGKFYWIKIKQYDDGSQHAIRIADKWSVAQWDGESFEEMNEMYRVEDVEEIGLCIPTNKEIQGANVTRLRYIEALKELIPLADEILRMPTGPDTFIKTYKGIDIQSAIERAKSLIQ